MTSFSNILQFFLKGHERSIKIKKNIVGNILIKVSSTVLSLVLIPLTITYVNPTKYGIWLTLSSVIAWISLFDIGLGGGLRNRLTQAISEGDTKLARIYVSTTYGVISGIIVVLMLLFSFLMPLLNWSDILNAPKDMTHELTVVAAIVFYSVSLQFVFKLITTVLSAYQQTSKASMLNFLGSLTGFITIFILTRTTHGSLTYLALALSLPPLIIFVISNFWFFGFKFKEIRPSLSHFNLKYLPNLANLGLQFFFIQIAGIVIFSTTNILISHLYGPKEVTPYNIANRLFNSCSMIFLIILTPFPPAFTDAYFRQDITWIKNSVRYLMKFWLFIAVMTILVFFASPLIYHLWIGNRVQIPITLSLVVEVYAILLSWNGIFTSFLNGVGKIRLQLYAGFIEAASFFPLAYFLSEFCKLGIQGIIIASIIPLISGSIWTYIQYTKILNNRATGIWRK